MSPEAPRNVPNPASPAPAAPPRKKKGIFRLRNLFVLLLLLVAAAFFGASPITKWAVEKYGTQALRTDVHLDGASVNIFTMNAVLSGLRVADPADPAKSQLQVAELHAKVAPLALLKRRVIVESLEAVSPHGRLVRNPDGTIGRPEEPPPGKSSDEWEKYRRKLVEQAKDRDVVEDVKNLLKKLKDKHDTEVAKKAEEERKAHEAGAPATTAEEKARAKEPALVIRELSCKGLTLDIEDHASGAPTQTLSDAALEVKELSSSPSNHDQPIELHLTGGKLADAKDASVALDGTLDLRGEDRPSAIKVDLENLPLARLDNLYKNAVPVAFVGQSLGTLRMVLQFTGWNIDWKPALILDRIDARARGPGQRIYGEDAETVARELTNAGRLPIDTLRLHGPAWAPDVDGVGDLVQRLVVEGGKNMAIKKGQEALQKQTDKLLEKNPGLKKKLDDAGATDVINKGGDAAKDAAQKALDLFGGKKKDSN